MKNHLAPRAVDPIVAKLFPEPSSSSSSTPGGATSGPHRNERGHFTKHATNVSGAPKAGSGKPPAKAAAPASTKAPAQPKPEIPKKPVAAAQVPDAMSAGINA